MAKEKKKRLSGWICLLAALVGAAVLFAISVPVVNKYTDSVRAVYDAAMEREARSAAEEWLAEGSAEAGLYYYSDAGHSLEKTPCEPYGRSIAREGKCVCVSIGEDGTITLGWA